MDNAPFKEKNASRSNDSNDWLAFKRCRNSVNIEIKQTKESYYKNALHANEGDSRQTWRIINELTSGKTTNCCVKEIKNNGKAICDSLELADSFNSHFSSIGTKLAKGWRMVLQKLWVSQNFSRISRVSHEGVKHFEVSVSQSKKSKCLGLAKKNAGLAVSQSLAFTIRHPFASEINSDNGASHLKYILREPIAVLS